MVNANNSYSAELSRLRPEQRSQLVSRLVKCTGAAAVTGQNTTLLELARLGFTLNRTRTDGWWAYEYAEGLREAGRLHEAKALLVKVYRRWTKRRHMMEIRLGLIHQDLGHKKMAERWFLKATRTAPGDTGPWIYLGAFFAHCERFADACTVLERGLSATGDLDEVWLNLGFNKRGLGDYEAARACFKKALKISPRYSAARIALSDMEQAIRVKALDFQKMHAWIQSRALASPKE